ncbi:hypothetical protein ABIB85_008397, partial [Bradyrhizobium sp. JR1.5]
DAPQNHGPQRKGIHKRQLQDLGASSPQSLQSLMPPQPEN